MDATRADRSVVIELAAIGAAALVFVATFQVRPPYLDFVLAAAAWSGAIGDSLWGGAMTIGGFKLHPLVLLFALSGSLMISRIRIPKL